jgi:alpha-D-ribose 1-methylphosphonate 5-phosphate C-P lyase
MIELTEEQVKALSEPQSNPPQLLNPQTKEAFVLLRVEEYKQLTTAIYDDTPWTREELAAVAWETDEKAGWDAETDDAAEDVSGPR